MAQTPTLYFEEGDCIDYTPGSAVAAGDVVLLGNMVGVAYRAIDAGVMGSLRIAGGLKFPKNSTDAPTQGQMMYWNPTGDPNGGTAGSGCAQIAATPYPIGPAIKAALAGDVRVACYLSPATGGSVLGTGASTVAATGSVQADAAALVDGFNVVTAADATKGVKLPAAVANRSVLVKNNANAVLKVWPATGDGINAIAVNSAISLAAFTSALFVAADATTWYTTPLVPS